MTPLISIIIPTYNREKTVLRAIKSAQNQTYKNFEIIVIDDASTDKTVEVLKPLSLKLIQNQKNLGVSASRNVGAKEAQGEYLAFLDSDDEWMPTKLEKQIHELNTTKSELIHTEEIWMRNGVRVNQPKRYKKSGGDVFKRSCELCIIAPSSVLINKKIFFELGGFREDFVVCEDYDLWLKYTSKYECTFIDEPLMVKYGGDPDQLSTKYFAMDYYRIKALDSILESVKLSSDKREHAKLILIKKAEVLLQGYIKHNNLTNLEEIKSILNKYL